MTRLSSQIYGETKERLHVARAFKRVREDKLPAKAIAPAICGRGLFYSHNVAAIFMPRCDTNMRSLSNPVLKRKTCLTQQAKQVFGRGEIIGLGKTLINRGVTDF